MRAVSGKRLLELSIGLLVMSGAVVASAGWVRDASKQKLSGVSGIEGAKSEESSVGGEYHALRSFKFWDYDRRACRIEVSQASFNAEHITMAKELKICEPNVGESWKAVDLGQGRFVSAVQVCTNKGEKAEQKIRGARFWGAVIDAGGKIADHGKPASFELADCQKWHAKKACPKGTIATGLRAHYDDKAKGFSGLELVCSGIKAQGG
jgi:hypothetical protein